MFKVPESCRLRHGNPLAGNFASDESFGNNGAFISESTIPGWRLLIIASDGDGWEHVSVHAFRIHSVHRFRTPYWEEMILVKRTFWGPDDVAIQIAPREADYVNCHPSTLHWWRPIGHEIPTPPSDLVGPRV